MVLSPGLYTESIFCHIDFNLPRLPVKMPFLARFPPALSKVCPAKNKKLYSIYFANFAFVKLENYTEFECMHNDASFS